jgi:methionyl-tRNA formyltransferase
VKIVFIGSVVFSKTCLEEVIRNGGNVIAVFTIKRDPTKFSYDFSDLADIAKEQKIPLFYFKKINDTSTIAQLRQLKPDVIFAFGISQIISSEILHIPPRGCIGAHPTLLPKHRGRHPIIWALVNGLTESGLTFFYMDNGADSGDILWQQSFAIHIKDDAYSLYCKIEEAARKAIGEFLPQLQEGKASRIPQDHSKASYWRKRSEEDGQIRWNTSSMQIYNLVRGLTHPYPGAHTFLQDEKITIWKSRLLEENKKEPIFPGQILVSNPDSFIVGTGDGYLEVLEWSYINNRQLVKGAQFSVN